MFNFDDYLQQGYQPLTLESWMGQGNLISLDEFLYGKENLEAKKAEDAARMQRERMARVTIPGILEQFVAGGLKDLTWGMLDIGKEHPPSNVAEQVASGVGGFLGAMTPVVGPFAVGGKIAKALGGVTKAAIAGGKAVEEGVALSKIAKVANVAEYAVERVGGVALGMGLTDVTDPKTIPSRMLDGAKIGAIFAGAGAAHFTKSGFVNLLIRQFGGRALMAAEGQYSEGALQPENLANLVWSELLNSYFLAKGITPKMILEGSYRTPGQKAAVMAVDRHVTDLNAGIIPVKFFEITKGNMPISQIKGNIVPDIKPKDVTKFVERLAGVDGSKVRIKVKWDDVDKVYKPDGSDTMFLAIHEYNDLAKIKGLPPIFTVKTNVTGSNPATKAKLYTPADFAYNFYGVKVVDGALISEVASSRHLIGDATKINKKDFTGLRPVHEESFLSESIRLKPYDILFEIQTRGVGTSREVVAIPIAGGSKVTMKMPDTGSRLPTLSQLFNLGKSRKALEALQNEKLALERDIAQGTLSQSDVEYLDATGAAAHVGEGGWSPEALARQKTTDFFMYDTRTKKPRPLIGIDAVDINPGPYEIKLQRDKVTGAPQVLAIGERADPLGLDILSIDLGKVTPPIEQLQKPVVPGGVLPQEILDKKLAEIDFLEKGIAQTEMDLTLGKEMLEAKTGLTMKTVDPHGKPIEIDLSAVSAAANQRAKLIRAIPEYPLPKAFEKVVDAKLAELNVIGIDAKKFFHLLNPNEKTPKLKHLERIGDMLSKLERTPAAQRFDFMIRLDEKLAKYINKPLYDPREEGRNDKPGGPAWQAQELNKIDEAYLYSFRTRAIARAQERSKKDGLPTMVHLLMSEAGENWLDMNKWAIKMTRRTGLPFYQLQQALDTSAQVMRKTLSGLANRLTPFAGIDKDGQFRLKQYYEKRYSGLDVNDIPLKPKELEFIEVNDAIMQELAPLVAKHQFLIWKQEVYDKESVGVKSTVMAFKNQNKDDVKLFLERGEEAYGNQEEARQSIAIAESRGMAPTQHDIDKANQFQFWLVEAVKRKLGTIEEGSYLPRNILSNTPVDFDKYTESMSVTSTGKGHIKHRTLQEAEADSIVGQFRGQNLFVQLTNYYKQVLILENLGPHLDAMGRVVDLFASEMEQAKPRMVTKKGTEAKTFSLKDSMEIYAMRLKGYPLKSGGLSRILRNIQTAFFKALVVRPDLWARNLYQPYQTAQHMRYMLDPRYLGKGLTFANLPDKAKDWEQTVVSERQNINQEYIHATVQEKFYDTPVLGTILRWTDKVGEVYSTTDEINRKRLFNKVWWKTKDNIDKLYRKEITFDQMESALGVRKLDLEEVRKFREFVAANNPVDAASWLGQLFCEGSQWKYRRFAKSIHEQTAEGESYTNLLTWSKGLAQQYYQKFNIAIEGIRMAKDNPLRRARELRKVSDILITTGSMYLAAQVGNAILNTITNKEHPKYAPFDMGSWVWQFGGVTVQIATEFTKGLADVVSSLDKTKEERIISTENLLKTVDNVTIRQMIPFAKQILSVYESVTGRSYVSPLSEIFNKVTRGYIKGDTIVQRTLLEGMLHGLFCSDPNKSAAVRQWTYKTMLEMKAGVANEKNPVMLAWYKLMAARYTHLNDLFMRYEPLEVYKNYQKRMQLKFMQDMEDATFKSSYQNEDRWFFNERMWEEGYTDVRD